VAARAHQRIAELAHRAELDLAAQLFGHQLHAVADAQDRHAGFEDLGAPAASRPRARNWAPDRMMPFSDPSARQAERAVASSKAWISQ
jgi:hypothetical protein